MRIQNQSGMTLIEVMFAALLVSLLGAAVVGIGALVSNSMHETLVNQDEYTISNQIRSLFENEQSCRLALGGPVNFGPPWGPSAYSHTVSPTGPTSLVIYHPVPLSAGRPVFLDPLNPSGNVVGHWEATAITIEPVSGSFTGPGVYPAKVTLALARQNDYTTRGYTIPIYLTIQLDSSNQIVSCYPINFRSDGQPAPVCDPLYFVPSTVTDNGAFTAVPAGPFLGCRQIKCIPPKVPIGGWDRFGNINCN